MGNEKKWCPLLSMTPSNEVKQSALCCESECAWWCEWNKCCAITEVAGGLFDIKDGMRNA